MIATAMRHDGIRLLVRRRRLTVLAVAALTVACASLFPVRAVADANLRDLPQRVQYASEAYREALAEFRLVLAAKEAVPSDTRLEDDPQLLRLIAQLVTLHQNATNAYNEMQYRTESSGGEVSEDDQRALDQASRLVDQLEPIQTSGYELARASNVDPLRIAFRVGQQWDKDEKTRKMETLKERAAFLEDVLSDGSEPKREPGPEPYTLTDEEGPRSGWDAAAFNALYKRYQATALEYKQFVAELLDRLDVLSASGEEICHDPILAYCYSQMPEIGKTLVQDFEAVFKAVYPNWGVAEYNRLVAHPDEAFTRLPVEDQIAFAEVAKSFQDLVLVRDYAVDELKSKASGCDLDELADLGRRVAEEGQDPETGLDAGAETSGTGGGTGGLTANFIASPTSGDVPLTVHFTDRSSGGEIESWLWTFGDGGTSVVANPTHQYTDEGNFTVTLTVEGHDGSDTETKAGYISVSSSGELRYVRTGDPSIQEKTRADCDGGYFEFTNVSDPVFPAEIRQDGNYTISITLTWASGGPRWDEFVFAVVLHMAGFNRLSGQITSPLNGSRTFDFTFSGSELSYLNTNSAMTLEVSGGVTCVGTGGSTTDEVHIVYVQPYTLQGSN